MGPSILGAALAAMLGGAPPAPPVSAHLFTPVSGPNGATHWTSRPYTPEDGDLFLFDDGNRWAHLLYKIAGSGGPLHSSMIIRRPDGRPALLEAGPNLSPKIYLLDLEPRLSTYYGMILVRRLKTPLTPDQSAQLTQFALAQEGKPYDYCRLALQVTPFRPRGTLRTLLFGRTSLDRSRWICCELTGAAATAAGVLNKKKFFANAMYPYDYAYDEHYDLSPHYEAPALWYPRPQLEMVGNAIKIIDGRDGH